MGFTDTEKASSLAASMASLHGDGHSVMRLLPGFVVTAISVNSILDLL